MAEHSKPRGGVVVPTDAGLAGLVQLLTVHARDRLAFDYYSHPYHIDVEIEYHFLIVLSVENFQSVVKYYDTKQRDLPLIVHIDTPAALENFDHARAYPGVEVMTLRRAALDDGGPDVTLEINLVGKVLDRLNA